MRAGEVGLQMVDLRRVLGHEHENFHAGSGAIDCKRSPRVACRRDGQAFEAEAARHAHGHGHTAALEAAGRQLALILDQ